MPPRVSLAGPAHRLKEGWRTFRHGPLGQRLTPLIDGLRRLGLVASTSRFVLSVGDEGATLVQFRGRHVVDALFVGPEAEDGPATLRGYIEADRQARVMVLVDVLEQMYREETLPKVSRLDRLTIVKRRLELAFPHDPLKAALPLERAAKSGGGTILCAALPITTGIEQWTAFLEGLPNPVIGYCLLPLESVGLAARLAPAAEGEGRRVWRALVSQQATSGFRQIFESDGHLVVTRLTQRPPGDLSPEAVALLIERELRSSISYIKRLGYTEFDRLDLVVLADPDACRAVEARDLPVSSLTALTPWQAAEALGFAPVGAEDGGFADILHAQVLASRRRPELSLPTPKLRERLKHDAAFKAGFVGAAALTLFTILYVGSLVFDYFDADSTAAILEQQLATQRSEVATAQRRLKSFPIPVDELALVDQTDTALAKEQVNPVGPLRAVAGALDPSARVQSVSFATPPPPGKGPAGPQVPATKQAPALYEIHLSVRFVGAGDAQPDVVVPEAKALRQRLAAALPGHEVTIVQLPLSELRTQVLEGSVGAGHRGGAPGPATAEYLIRKGA